MDPRAKVLTACAALLIAAVAGAGTAGAAGDAAEGKKIFATTCAACHAPDGKGITGLGKPLNDTTFLTTRDDAFIQDTVMKGRPGTMMTSFAHLGEDKVRDVVAYIRAWQTAGPDAGSSEAEGGTDPAVKPAVVFDGDPNNGKKVFGEHCASCHQEIKRYLSKASDENVMRVVDIVHTDTSTRSFTGAHTWATLSEAETRDIVVYMKKLYGEADEDAQLARLAEIESAAAATSSSAVPAVPADGESTATAGVKAPAQADILRGQDLFQGKIRFQKGGPSCIACHHVKNDAVIGGGVLAKDLTKVFTRMGGTGVQAILGQPPFPVMEQAYKDRLLTQDEVDSVIAFLQHADQESLMQKPRDYGRRLVVVGGAGAVLLVAAYSLVWGRRKKKKVNQDVFDRQIKSE